MNTADKRLIVLSGDIGIGKSTVCRKVAEIARCKGLACGGIISTKAGDSDIVVEDVKTGAREILAGGPVKYSGPRTGKYSFNPQGLQFGITAIREGTSEAILFVDELGHLEVRGEGFAEAFEILSGNEVNHALVVIRKELLDVLLPRFTGRPHIFEITVENRDTVAEQIMDYLGGNEISPSNFPAWR